MKMLREKFLSFFILSSADVRSLTLLTGLIGGFLVVPYLLHLALGGGATDIDYSKVKRVGSVNFVNLPKVGKKVLLKNIGPIYMNSIDSSQWLSAGFNTKQTGTILNYLRKGGMFHKKADLMKIYGISEEEYIQVNRCLVVNDHLKGKAKSNSTSTSRSIPVRINSATFGELMHAHIFTYEEIKKIISYRSRNGHFTDIRELLYGGLISSESYKRISSSITL